MRDEEPGMLSELSELQSDSVDPQDEEVWGMAEVSFTITTRSEDGREDVERHYTFSHAPEWDKWMLAAFTEKRRETGSRVWRTSRDLEWHEPDAAKVSIPDGVQEQLQELLDIDELTIQTPS
jgi:hypothetical protein